MCGAEHQAYSGIKIKEKKLNRGTNNLACGLSITDYCDGCPRERDGRLHQ